MGRLHSVFLNERIMLAMVVLNTCTIFAGGFGKAPEFFLWVDSFFTLLFLFEAVTKIRAYGWKQYWKENSNKFVFVITLVTLPSLANIFIEGNLSTNILLSLRTLRVFKSFRLLKFIPNINGLLKGVSLAVKASLIVSIAFAVLMLIIAILSSAVFGGLAPDLFGDPGLSLFTIFKLFTGDGWSEIPSDIVGDNTGIFSRIIRAVFAFLFFTGGILGLSLVNSIFVDAMASDNNDDVLERLDKIEQKLNCIKGEDQKQD